MTSTDSTQSLGSTASRDAVAERLNDPAVAAALVTVLDNAGLLSTLVLGLSEFVSRSETIMDSVAAGLHDLRASGAAGSASLPSLGDVKAITTQLVDAGPLLSQVLGSSMARPETIGLLSMLSEAATEGAANAQRNHTEVKGAMGALKAMKDPAVQRGLGLFIEIARALGRRMDAAG